MKMKKIQILKKDTINGYVYVEKNILVRNTIYGINIG